MQVAPSGAQICNLCKWRHLLAKFATNASGAIRWGYLSHKHTVRREGGGS